MSIEGATFHLRPVSNAVMAYCRAISLDESELARNLLRFSLYEVQGLQFGSGEVLQLKLEQVKLFGRLYRRVDGGQWARLLELWPQWLLNQLYAELLGQNLFAPSEAERLKLYLDCCANDDPRSGAAPSAPGGSEPGQCPATTCNGSNFRQEEWIARCWLWGARGPHEPAWLAGALECVDTFIANMRIQEHYRWEAMQQHAQG